MATLRPAQRGGARLAQSITKLILLSSSAFPLFGSPINNNNQPSSHLFHGTYLDGLVVPLSQLDRTSPHFWWMISVIVCLVLLGGCFAGLTLGLMGLDILNLRVLSTSGTEIEQIQAQKVLKLLERGRHWVLVVLLLSNVVVNETLPIFLDTVLGGGAAAILISTALIVVFGEIIPQSICVRYGLSIGAKSAPFVLALMYLEFPIAYPIALLLDYILGHDEGTTYRKAELKTFVGLHRHIGTDGLNEDEVTIISAVLDLSSKTIVDIMTPIEETFTLGEDSILDEKTVTELVSEGYSRVPIHQAGHDRNFIGMLLVKHLISYDPEDAKPVRDFQLSNLPEGSPEMTCLEALNFFQQGRSHMLLVSSQPGEQGGALGVVSLEDVIEEMIGEEIIDETDQYVDVAHKIKVVRKPVTNRTSTRGLAPLIKGVIEKRRQTGEPRISRSDVGDGDDYMSPDPILVTSGQRTLTAAAVAASNRSSMDVQSWRSPVLDKVKVKGGESRAQRAESEHRRRKLAKSSFNETHRPVEEDVSSSTHEDSGTENTPLLD
ncbi:hypothetical protein MJO28_012401 [Puccinia striiformis f. sp. tritici]|uniref:CNNM transmembrane domain-containing protein n=2 Tax=Puccinia striiformis f. sp. tritici TaxID=168172 RepID=A0A0L0UWE3_9BASI|nr:hypothetical protein Pst134EA_022695 [Puccinia striiformis f. sp. tritici]KNE91044.1 hypothetical protein PSTG_15518 [Puccinia striiformis f. sp. tritici PST-78]KAH9445737.1 hypothetical protein Pst134EB_023571 [Puccinia striiformis f. sp. tritici]KAH9455224.1 hypothetical protein Pst134EA_022695 [Puccinia striiformis f. sp. tritici]KAI7942374.1 hypothetical protein MJO28_012401 [Puccinia striiformis f. sp. tritici]KAI7945637.1 hypothetical protein MJO29_012025 [Puccinia striiformis f. sp. 